MDQMIDIPQLVLGCTAFGQDNCQQLLIVVINELPAPFIWVIWPTLQQQTIIQRLRSALHQRLFSALSIWM